MKTVIATLNAKYIHGSLAVRLLYVANKDRFDISFGEYTIKEDVERIACDLLSTGCDCIGLGVYIWNVLQTRKLVARLREMKPDVILILGGPEVSYEPEYFLNALPVDFVVSGEGEFVFGELLHALENGLPTTIDGISSPGNISRVAARADIDRLVALPSPYRLEEDRGDLPHKLIYFETSRGCPYRCSYCLSSLESGVRYFPYDYVFDNLQYLIENGARQIKFLDRTFNLNKKHAQRIFDFLIERHRPGLSCQFEIYADLMDEETIDRLNARLPDRFFRFEIGIQSTHEPSNKAVNRRGDFSVLSRNIRKLTEGGKVDLHLDLIAGLPHESFDGFVRSFDDVFAFGAKEVQLGFLKLLRGTELRRRASDYGYVFREEAPYEVISNRWMSAEEFRRIHDAEHALERYWNGGRFPLTVKAALDEAYRGRYFAFFDDLAAFAKQHAADYGNQSEDAFRCLNDFLQSKHIDLFDLLREDYYNSFTLRPAGRFWPDTLEKKERKRILEAIGKDQDFLTEHGLTAYIIKKQTAVDRVALRKYLLTVFLPEGRKRIVYTPGETGEGL